MSRHFKYSLDLNPGDGSRSLLRGQEVTDTTQLRQAYQESNFHYQFQSYNRPSRIMVCSSSSELAWLEGQIKDGARVVIYPNLYRSTKVIATA